MSPTNRQQQLDEVLEHFYDEFIDPQPHTFYISAGHAIQEIENTLNVDSQEAHDVWQLFKDRYVHPRPTKNSDLLSHEGIERVDEIRDDVPVDEDLQEELVDYLYNYYLENPSRAAVERDQLLDDFSASETKIDLNLYILKTAGWVETNTQVGIGDAGYRSAEISEIGRKKLS
ncbi:hypothetical protein ACFR9U_16200 [Halorientalis brevis]|uniref:Uncharacterized protein n=1 Tax=Halorientalis brevis TaxID=1126241 RepID=A0ABD6CDT6_9EURY|nr:hypothetical protein [Halorientalis brevis]